MISYLKVITVIRGQVMSDIILPSEDVVNDTNPTCTIYYWCNCFVRFMKICQALTLPIEVSIMLCNKTSSTQTLY